MIVELNSEIATTEAVIYLKSGKRIHGMLIEEMINDAYQFISNTNYSLFKESNDLAYVETVPSSLIETIDISLK